MSAVQTRPESTRTMGRKKGTRKTVMLRVYEETAETVLQFAAERRLTAADFVEAYMLPCGEKAHRDYIEAESRKLQKGGPGKDAVQGGEGRKGAKS
jgi:hypothetical protein